MVTRKSKTSHKATGKGSTSTRSRSAGKTVRAAIRGFSDQGHRMG